MSEHTIYLTHVTDEAVREIPKHFRFNAYSFRNDTFVCRDWLKASMDSSSGKVYVRGITCPDPDDEGEAAMYGGNVCLLDLSYELRMGHSVFLTPDVHEFIGLVNRYLLYSSKG